jgi:hypothetical protein
MNTTQLISSIKRKTSMPTSQDLWTDDRILESINEEFQISMVPLMMRIQEDHFTTYQAYDTYSRTIPIPAKAIGSKIKSLGFYQQDYLQQNIPRIDEENTVINNRLAFLFEKYSVKLMFDQFPNMNQELRMYYYKRPNSLALDTSVARIESIGTVATSVVVSAANSVLVDGAVLDAQSSTNPFSLTAEGLTVASVSGSEIFLDSVEGLSVGDYLCEEGYSFFPNVPVELHSLLAQRVAVKILEANGSQAEMAAAQGIYTQMERDSIYILTPRADGTTQKFTPGRSISAYV